MKKLILFLSIFLFFGSSHAQEVKCEVSINFNRLDGVDVTMFEDMKQQVYDFINNRKWTGDIFQESEKIEFSVLIELASIEGGNTFSGTIQIQSRRPVYASAYNSTVFSFKDEQFSFTYDRFANLEYSESTFLSNLTSVLAYYTYMVIGYDYDTYKLEGGTKYFQKAQQIAGTAQSSGGQGWSSSERRNRYWLVENHLTPRFRNLRVCSYEYHRNGFDQMAKDVTAGRTAVTNALLKLEEVHRNFPNSFNMRVFFDSKSKEIIKLYQDAPRAEKDKIIDLLNKVDPANTINYQKIL
ncbi:DUF4835 family protein [bacterium]|jgi:hypothetical protein|nr:DUF4835 domain-containing protein [Crocinitomicaceae bacterium]MCH9821773.1 DUF4835 family protein [Bacteroidota bacterium]MDB9983947.1 DUF4835 family protein [bacterium]|tara:strand:- start:72554 stop:73441 length:888 start_codon:yes stop_codon:yes gene_type:complete